MSRELIPLSGYTLPRDLRVGDEIERQDPHDGSRSCHVTITQVRKETTGVSREVEYVVVHSGAYGHTTFRLKPKSRIRVFRRDEGLP